MKIIGLGHKMGQGKGEVAEALAQFHGYEIIHFADILKRSAMVLASLSERDVYTQEGKATHNEFLGMTHGAFLQLLGSLMRENIRKDFWIQALAQGLEDGGKYVIEDVRYPNEAQWIRDMGGMLILVDRPGYVAKGRDPNHPSETALNDWNWDYTIVNDGTLERLRAEVQYSVLKATYWFFEERTNGAYRVAINDYENCSPEDSAPRSVVLRFDELEDAMEHAQSQRGSWRSVWVTDADAREQYAHLKGEDARAFVEGVFRSRGGSGVE